MQGNRKVRVGHEEIHSKTSLVGVAGAQGADLHRSELHVDHYGAVVVNAGLTSALLLLARAVRLPCPQHSMQNL